MADIWTKSESNLIGCECFYDFLDRLLDYTAFCVFPVLPLSVLIDSPLSRCGSVHPEKACIQQTPLLRHSQQLFCPNWGSFSPTSMLFFFCISLVGSWVPYSTVELELRLFWPLPFARLYLQLNTSFVFTVHLLYSGTCFICSLKNISYWEQLK